MFNKTNQILSIYAIKKNNIIKQYLDMTKTSHKKNRPFDFKLIDLVEPHPVLYLRQIPGMNTFEMMKTKNLLWQQIAAEMGYPVQFCLNRWNNLRGQFQKELKHSNELCTKTGLIKGSTWPYLDRLRFLECTVQANKPKKDKKPKRKVKVKKQLENDTKNLWIQEDTESLLSGDYEHEFNVEEITHGDAPNILEETYEEDFAIIEEIAEEVVGTESIEQTDVYLSNSITSENYRRMQALLSSFEGETLQRIERRLMAFICKCQLRSLGEQTIDDLFV